MAHLQLSDPFISEGQWISDTWKLLSYQLLYPPVTSLNLFKSIAIFYSILDLVKEIKIRKIIFFKG